MAQWEENKHPRDGDGKFTSSGGTPAEHKRLQELGIEPKEKPRAVKTPTKVSLGKINTSIYDNILGKKLQNTDIVVPNTNIIHANNRHLDIYEKYKNKLSNIINSPDYIFEGNTDNRVLVVKNIDKDVEVVLELSLENKHFSNKIVSMWELSEKDMRKLEKNKKILYKSK